LFSHDFNPSAFYVWGRLKNPRTQFQLNTQRHFASELLLRVKPFTTVPGRLNRATARDHTCTHVYKFMWRTLRTSVVTCDLINNQNSTVINWNSHRKCIMATINTSITQLKYLLLNKNFQFSQTTINIFIYLFIYIFALI